MSNLIEVKAKNISVTLDDDSNHDVKALVDISVSSAKQFIKYNPTCTIEIFLADSYSKFKISFNDRRKNSITFGVNCFDTDTKIEQWIRNIQLVSSDLYSTMIKQCFNEYYQHDGSIKYTAITPLEFALKV